jgi:hypothetical protein
MGAAPGEALPVDALDGIHERDEETSSRISRIHNS